MSSWMVFWLIILAVIVFGTLVNLRDIKRFFENSIDVDRGVDGSGWPPR